MYAEGRGPFYNQIQAANYCGYSADHFRKLIKKYNLRRHGPNKTRFAQSELDAWMMNPEAFNSGAATKIRRPIRLEV